MYIIIMCIQITVPDIFLAVVLSDLTTLRRSHTIEIDDHAGDTKVVTALVPVSSLNVSQSIFC